MSIEEATEKKLRVIFWGVNGVYSRTVLETLLQAGVNMAAVIIDRSAASGVNGSPAYRKIDPPSAPASSVDDLEISLGSGSYVATNTVNIAWQHGLPVYAIGHLAAPQTIKLLATLNADIACVACFPRRFPKAVLAVPKHGFLNLHPSRLPDYRGPAPLFWQFRDSVNPLGVTVHWMDATLDTGDIASQAEVMLPNGIDGPDADQRLAAVGGGLLVDVLDAVERGEDRRQAQQPGGSYQAWPRTEDFRMDRAWSAQRAFNFMRGTAEWGRPYPLTIGDEELLLKHALDLRPKHQLPTPLHRDGQMMHIQFASGVLIASAWP